MLGAAGATAIDVSVGATAVTVSVVDAVTPLYEAAMVVAPTATAVTIPLEFTVAIPELPAIHFAMLDTSAEVPSL
jgi:hypothetical protein